MVAKHPDIVAAVSQGLVHDGRLHAHAQGRDRANLDRRCSANRRPSSPSSTTTTCPGCRATERGTRLGHRGREVAQRPRHHRYGARSEDDLFGEVSFPSRSEFARARGDHGRTRFASLCAGERRGRDRPALDDVSLDINRGEFVSLLGPSGCGKSTLLNIIGGLITPSAGRVTVGEVDVRGPLPREVAFVFQESTLLPWYTVLENFRVSLEFQGQTNGWRDRATAALSRVGMESVCRASIRPALDRHAPARSTWRAASRSRPASC